MASINAAELRLMEDKIAKIHGCCERNPLETVWCAGQRVNPAISQVLEDFRAYMSAALPEQILLIIGFWTDWSHIQESIISATNEYLPNNIYVVDPLSREQLENKAPQLWNSLDAAGKNLFHIRMGGDDFLSSLRLELSAGFISKLIDGAAEDFENNYGHPPTDDRPTKEWLDSDGWYNLRRDLTGKHRGEPVRHKALMPGFEPSAAFCKFLLENGFSYDGDCWIRGELKMRVVPGNGRGLGIVKKHYESEPKSATSNYINVCAGALDDADGPLSVVRGKQPRNVVRVLDRRAEWITHDMARGRIEGGQ
jgi:hypothetical protein